MKLATFLHALLLFTFSSGFPDWTVDNAVSCETYAVSWNSGLGPFFITALSNSLTLQEMWSMNNITGSSAFFPIFFPSGTTVTLSVFDRTETLQTQVRLTVDGNSQHYGCANSSHATNAALSQSLIAVGSCDITNLQWVMKGQDHSSYKLKDVTIQTLNLFQNINHTIFALNGTGLDTQIRLPSGVQYRLVVGVEGGAYSSSEPLIVQSSSNNNTDCLIQTFNPIIDNAIPVIYSTTSFLPILNVSASTASLDLSLKIGLGISVSALLIISVSGIYLRLHQDRFQLPKYALPSTIRLQLANQIMNLTNQSRPSEATSTPDPNGNSAYDVYLEKESQSPYIVKTAHDDPNVM